MNVLAEICATMDHCLAAAWVDTRTRVVLEQRATRDDAFIAPVLEAVTEAMSSRERPPRMVLLSADHVHIAQRLTRDPHRVLVVICARAANLGLVVAVIRSILDAMEPST